jgi:hypothetical protein
MTDRKKKPKVPLGTKPRKRRDQDKKKRPGGAR